MRHLIKFNVVFICAFIVSCLLSSVTFAVTTAPARLASDVRVIIDISGSMKKTDPRNLRKPAVDLIVRLMPDNSKAGIWTFGQSVNMLVPHRVVDDAWRKQAATQAKSINSIALHTNIGAALEKATEDFAVPSDDYRRNIILLTDGVVDVNNAAVVNLNERKRILTELLPKLKAAGYVIHTIALSQDADQELMKKLSTSTDGMFAVAQTADELMSTFLRIFDQAVPAERVPFDENGFLVDASIQEFTALIFRQTEVPATVIVAPDGREFSATDPEHNVNWYRTDTYDLVTVQQPQAGQWHVKTKMAPNSRVTVVSNLQLIVNPPHNNLKPNESLALVYSFSESDQVVVKQEFLQLLSADAVVAKMDSQEIAEYSLNPSAIPADGIFHASVSGFTLPGNYDVKMIVDGKTFKREFSHHLVVSDSLFSLKKSQQENQGKRTYAYQLLADITAVDVMATQVTAKISNSLDNNMAKALNAIGKEHWEFSFTPVQAAKYTIELVVEGKELDGTALSETIVADDFYYPDEASVLAAQAAAHPEPAPVVEKHEEATKEAVPTDENQDHDADESGGDKDSESNIWLYIGIGMGNLLLLVMVFFVYRMIAGSKGKSELAAIEETLNTDISKVKKSAETPKNGTAKTVINVSGDEDIAEKPITEPTENLLDDSDAEGVDQMMADDLFPIDNIEDTDQEKP